MAVDSIFSIYYFIYFYVFFPILFLCWLTSYQCGLTTFNNRKEEIFSLASLWTKDFSKYPVCTSIYFPYDDIQRTWNKRLKCYKNQDFHTDGLLCLWYQISKQVDLAPCSTENPIVRKLKPPSHENKWKLHSDCGLHGYF